MTLRNPGTGPVVTLTVDDCWGTHARAFQRDFEALSLRGVFYPIAGFIGREVNRFRFVDWEDLRDMSTEGHEVGSHSLTHRGSALGLTTRARQLFRLVGSKGPIRSVRLTRALLGLAEEYPLEHRRPAEEIARSKQLIENELGKACRSYSYPGGEPTAELVDSARNAGYTSARTVRPGFNHFHRLCPYSLRSQVWDRWTTARNADKWVDKAISQNLWLIEVFHAIDLQHYPYSCSESSLKKHLAYIRSRDGEIDNLTISETIDRVNEGPTISSPLSTLP